VEVVTHVDTEPGSYLHGMAVRLAGAAAEAGVLSAPEHAGWLAELAAQDSFFASINHYLCVGRRP
jgi:hypothetical protein